MNSTTSPTQYLFNLQDPTNSKTNELQPIIQGEKPKWLKYQTNLSKTNYSQGFGDLQSDKSLNSIGGIRTKTLKCRQNKMKNQIRNDVTAYSPYKKNKPLSKCINNDIDEITTSFSSSLSKTISFQPENSKAGIENDLTKMSKNVEN